MWSFPLARSVAFSLVPLEACCLRVIANNSFLSRQHFRGSGRCPHVWEKVLALQKWVWHGPLAVVALFHFFTALIEEIVMVSTDCMPLISRDVGYEIGCIPMEEVGVPPG